jgi:hypothetical protein
MNHFFQNIKNNILIGSLLVLLPFSTCFAASAVEYALLYLSYASQLRNDNTCVLSTAASGSDDSGITIRNKANLVGTCGVRSNSNIDVKQQAVVNGPQLSATDNVSVGKNASVSPAPLSFLPPLALPPATNLGLDTSDCDFTKLEVTADSTLQPGVYCKGLTVKGANVNFAPGTYIIKNGDLKIRGESNVTGGTVFFIFTKSSAEEKIGSVSIISDSKVNLDGALFFQLDPSANNSSNKDENEIRGSQVNINGYIITPNRKFSIEGKADVESSLCLVLIANTVELAGRAKFDTSCDLPPPPAP